MRAHTSRALPGDREGGTDDADGGDGGDGGGQYGGARAGAAAGHHTGTTIALFREAECTAP
ncbi:hypothetical protein ACFYNW_14375 [Streptomyces virginiae]|uniref:hypothetical protein n=1 Tax=Streptomyces virginiae TaxID=1961 RepID=UPI00339E9AD3